MLQEFLTVCTVKQSTRACQWSLIVLNEGVFKTTYHELWPPCLCWLTGWLNGQLTVTIIIQTHTQTHYCMRFILVSHSRSQLLILSETKAEEDTQLCFTMSFLGGVKKLNGPATPFAAHSRKAEKLWGFFLSFLMHSQSMGFQADINVSEGAVLSNDMLTLLFLKAVPELLNLYEQHMSFAIIGS